jgi:hypothetical protein
LFLKLEYYNKTKGIIFISLSEQMVLDKGIINAATESNVKLGYLRKNLTAVEAAVNNYQQNWCQATELV